MATQSSSRPPLGIRANHAERMRALVSKFDPHTSSLVAFCSEHGLALSTFRYWQRRLLAAESQSASFLEVSVDSQSSSSGFEIRLSSGDAIQIPESLSEEAWTRLLRSLKSSC